MSDINDIPGVGPAIALGLANIGITTTQQLSQADVATLTQVRGISEARAERFITLAEMALAAPEMPETAPVRTNKTEGTKPSKDKSKSKKGSDNKGNKAKKKKKAKKEKKARKSKKKK
ncbi:MAG: helix-hairpin-helix domain-containing protein [Roseovarius sp.]